MTNSDHCTQKIDFRKFFQISRTKKQLVFSLGFMGAVSIASPAIGKSLASCKHCEELSLRQIDASVLLKGLINALLAMLADIDETQLSPSILAVYLEVIDSDASILINSYSLYGIASSLTSQEVQSGIDDCNEAIALIDEESENIELSTSLLISLHFTLNAMRSDLENAQ